MKYSLGEKILNFNKRKKVVVRTEPENKTVEILLVEDDLGDRLLMQEVLKRSRFPIHLNTARDGEEAMSFLRREGNFSGVVEPDLILLDLNMPRKDGREVLKEIREDPRWGRIPVLILTTSRDEQDRVAAYQARANFFIVKPSDMDHLMQLVRYLEDFWFQTILPAA